MWREPGLAMPKQRPSRRAGGGPIFRQDQEVFCGKIFAAAGSVADPDPGSGTFLTPGSGMGKNPWSGSGLNNPDHISESLETFFWVKILKFFDADPGSGMEKIQIRDLG